MNESTFIDRAAHNVLRALYGAEFTMHQVALVLQRAAKIHDGMDDEQRTAYYADAVKRLARAVRVVPPGTENL